MMKLWKTLGCVGCVALALIVVERADAESIVNGGFETGDFTGWTLSGAPVVTNAPAPAPLAGNWSADVLSFTTISQSFDPLTAEGTAIRFVFNAVYGGTGSSAHRVVNLGFNGANAGIQIKISPPNATTYNVDVYDADLGWQEDLIAGLTEGVNYTFILTFNSFGSDSTYNISVGGQTVSNLGYYNVAGVTGLDNLTGISVGTTIPAGSRTLIDNISVAPPQGTVISIH